MRKLAGLLRKDLTLGVKDIFILLELFFAVVMSLLIVFVVPQDVETEATVFIYDSTALVRNFVAEFAVESPQEQGEFFVDSRDAVVEGMRENRSAVGIIIGGRPDGRYDVDVLTQPYTTDAMVAYLEADLRDLMAVLAPSDLSYDPAVYQTVRLDALAQGRRDEIPFNQRIVPPVLLMMVGVIGLFAMVSLLGQERADKTIRALRVSPTGLAAVLTSKHLTLLITGFATFSVIYLSTIGVSGYGQALVVMLLTILIGSSLGAILGSYFENPLGAVGWVFVVMIVLGLPAVSLFNPVFSPGWMRLIPSYYTLFGLDAAMFPAQNEHVVWRSVGVLAGIAAVLLPLSGWIYMARTRKEA